MGDCYDLFFKSSQTERYETDMNDRVRMHLENAGVKLVRESGGTARTAPENEATASDNLFTVECDGEVALRLGREIGAMLGHRAVYVEPVGP